MSSFLSCPYSFWNDVISYMVSSNSHNNGSTHCTSGDNPLLASILGIFAKCNMQACTRSRPYFLLIMRYSFWLSAHWKTCSQLLLKVKIDRPHVKHFSDHMYDAAEGRYFEPHGNIVRSFLISLFSFWNMLSRYCFCSSRDVLDMVWEGNIIAEDFELQLQ